MRSGNLLRQILRALRSFDHWSFSPSTLIMARSAMISLMPLVGSFCWRFQYCLTTFFAMPQAQGMNWRDGSNWSSDLRISMTVSWNNSSAISKSRTIDIMNARIRERFSLMLSTAENEY